MHKMLRRPHLRRDTNDDVSGFGGKRAERIVSRMAIDSFGFISGKSKGSISPWPP